MSDLTIQDLMRPGVATGPSATALDDVSRLLNEHDAGAFLVMEEGVAIGVVLGTDLAHATMLPRSRGRGRTRTVGELMTTPVVSLSLEASLYEALSVLQQFRIHRLVVARVAPEGPRPIGVLTMSDILRGLGRLGADASTPGQALRRSPTSGECSASRSA
jgi:CBS domain-containing protein